MDHRNVTASKRTHDRNDKDNEYETANLGSDARNQKFLRLMGGAKKSGPGNVPHANPVRPHPAEEYKPEPVDEVTDTGDSGRQETEDIELNVHSANKWENVELGDVGRKNKFLRLMGAARQSSSQPTGTPAIPERKGFDTTQLERDLEQQYEQGLEFRRSGGVRKHRGFGFIEEPPPPIEPKGDEGNEQDPSSSRQGNEERHGPYDREERINSRRDRDNFRQNWDDHERDRSENRRDRDDYRRDRDHSRRDREDFRRDPDDSRRDRVDFRRDRDDFRRNRDDFRRDRKPSRWDRDDFKRDGQEHHRDDYRGNKGDFRREKPEYKSDPSEYGRVPRENRQQTGDQQGHGSDYGNFQSGPVPSGPAVTSHGSSYQPADQPKSQWSQSYPAQSQTRFQPAQPAAPHAYDWSKPPPPPPPEPDRPRHQAPPSYSAQNYYGSQQSGYASRDTYSGSYGTQTGLTPQTGYGQPGDSQQYRGGVPPPPAPQQTAYGKYPKPMSFVKSVDS